MRAVGIVAIVCVLGAGYASSQQTRRTESGAGRTIGGTVVDPAGGALPGVSVELRRADTVEQRTVSDAAGAWRFEQVAPADYTVRFMLPGFVTTDLRLTVGDASTRPVRVVLKVGALSETVEVAGAPDGTLQRAGAASLPAGVVGGIAHPAVPRQGTAESWEPRPWFWPPAAPFETASYARIDESPFRRVADHPLSTFSIDVDTASYANVRRFLNQGRLPPADAVRIEEMINYFRFDYPRPGGDAPVAVATEAGPAPWNPAHRLVLVGLRAAAPGGGKTPPRNLTFLLDVSGSMAPASRLPLVRTAMQMLADTLRPEDTVAIVVYAGHSGLVLPATSGARRDVIRHAIGHLRAGGSTNGAEGIRLAYQIASQNFVEGGVNRVILATDGDFNVGVTSRSELTRLIEEQREKGIFLSVLGVGDDNLQDATMEMLADKGNGNYSYLDSIQEARRVLVAEAGATLVTVAKDVKLQIEFNPRFVGAYRLIGYENRALAREDFNNDRKDAGEMGAGHTVTALYELVPPGAPVPGGDVDPLKYQAQPERPVPAARSDELMTIKLRYKTPGGGASRLLEFPVRASVSARPRNLGFAAAVAEFGMLLRRSEFTGEATWAQAAALGRAHRGEDPDGYRGEFVRLVELAASLDRTRPTTRNDQGTP